MFSKTVFPIHSCLPQEEMSHKTGSFPFLQVHLQQSTFIPHNLSRTVSSRVHDFLLDNEGETFQLCFGGWVWSLSLPRFLPPINNFVLFIPGHNKQGHQNSLPLTLDFSKHFCYLTFCLAWPWYPSYDFHFFSITLEVDQGIK